MQLFTICFAVWAAYNFGPAFGYRFYDARDPFGAAFYGGGTVFMLAAIVGAYIVWPMVRTLWNGMFGNLSRMQLSARRRLKQNPPMSPAEIEEKVRRGYLFAYHGLVNKDFFYNVGGESRRARVRCDYTVQRNTGAITRREQEAVIIFETLVTEKLLPAKMEDKLRFALAWGDGRCDYTNGKFKPSAAMAQQNGIHGFADVIKQEGGDRGVSVEGAISILYTCLQQAADAKQPSPAASRLMGRYSRATGTPPGVEAAQWS